MPCVLLCSGSSLKVLLKRILEMEPFPYHPEFSSPDMFYKRRNDKTPCKIKWLASIDHTTLAFIILFFQCLRAQHNSIHRVTHLSRDICARTSATSSVFITSSPNDSAWYLRSLPGLISGFLLYLYRVFLVPCLPCAVLIVKLSPVHFISLFFHLP